VRAAVFPLLAVLAAAGCGQPKPVVVAPPSPPSSQPPLSAPAPATSEARLREELNAIFSGAQFDRAFWSVVVRSVDSVQDLFALNATKLMMPGSTMKIVTAAASAERLGWDYRFETRVVATGPIENGVLRGDLVVIGSGDPGISERSDHPGALRAMARRVRESGITRIEGRILGEDDLFDDRGFGDGWTLDNVPYGYSAPVTALLYNEGSVDLVIQAGSAAGEPVAILVRPDGSGLDVDNRLTTVPETGSGMLTLRRLPGSSRLVVEGQIPATAAPFARTASVENPTKFFASALRLSLLDEGVAIDGDAADADELAAKPDLAGSNVVATLLSAPLSEQIAAMMKVSQNQYAESLLKRIGGRSSVQQVLAGWGIAPDSYVVADGSGLSRYNYVTSDALVRILQVMYGEPKHQTAFTAALPVAGRDGTLARRLAGTPAEGKVRAKTGTVDNVRAIAGYVQTGDGETFVFAMMANNFNVANGVVDEAADRALIRLATFTRLSSHKP
jgi:D-alanyl-D-alanine carboxypeptidase/D-alanyl-D-alanine-endopeptidase (penicillin-binding protein 4)